jgi:acetyl-CoA synthetase
VSATSYEAARSAHCWVVPAQYNSRLTSATSILATTRRWWESFDGSYRELTWGELQDLANQAAHTPAARGVKRGARVAVIVPSRNPWRLWRVGKSGLRGWATAQVTSDRAERATRFTADGEGGRLAHVVDGAHQERVSVRGSDGQDHRQERLQPLRPSG